MKKEKSIQADIELSILYVKNKIQEYKNKGHSYPNELDYILSALEAMREIKEVLKKYE